MIELWGDGTPTRDFLYVDDAAAGLILAAEKYDSVESVNLGTGIETSIQDVAKLIMEIMDIILEIKWQISQKTKLLTSSLTCPCWKCLSL